MAVCQENTPVTQDCCGGFTEYKRSTSGSVKKIQRIPRCRHDSFETEVSFEGESGFHARFSHCKKHPGHGDFIPVDDLDLEHLPENFRDKDVLTLIRALAAITVRVETDFVSPGRPRFYQDTDIPYPFHNAIGDRMLRTGSGRVRYVTVPVNKKDQPCPCHVCKTSGKPKRMWCKVGVVTATHVVYDEEEARHTTCRVGFNSDTSPVVTFEGMGVSAHGAHVDGDRFNLCCVTHDLDLARKLRRSVARYKQHCLKISKKIDSGNHDNRLAIVVSHPHGCAKKVTIGRWTEKFRIAGTGYTVYHYTACTCPGTSGAPVYILDRQTFGWCNHPHSAARVDVNCSGVGYA